MLKIKMVAIDYDGGDRCDHNDHDGDNHDGRDYSDFSSCECHDHYNIEDDWVLVDIFKYGCYSRDDEDD